MYITLAFNGCSYCRKKISTRGKSAVGRLRHQLSCSRADIAINLLNWDCLAKRGVSCSRNFQSHPKFFSSCHKSLVLICFFWQLFFSANYQGCLDMLILFYYKWVYCATVTAFHVFMLSNLDLCSPILPHLDSWTPCCGPVVIEQWWQE